MKDSMDKFRFIFIFIFITKIEINFKFNQNKSVWNIIDRLVHEDDAVLRMLNHRWLLV